MSMSRLESYLYFALIMILVTLAVCILGFLAMHPAPSLPMMEPLWNHWERLGNVREYEHSHTCVCEHVPCTNGRLCPFETVCCEQGCCPVPSGSPLLNEIPSWYVQWPVLFLLGTLGGILLCCIWCLFFKRSSRPNVFPYGARNVYWSFHCCVRRPASDHDSAGSIYPPPRYSRCGSIHQAPPPYSEVTSKPDLYPLVITCGEGEGKSAGGTGTVMVHFYRNYVIRAPGSLSATSTAESLNSSLMSNSANEANSIIPPPYSCASNYEDCVGLGYGRSLLRSLSSLTERERPPRPRPSPDPTPAATTPPRRETTAAFRENLITSPVQPLDTAFDLELELIDCELYCDGGCKPRLGTSPPCHRPPSSADDCVFEREAYSLRRLFACPSPEPGACQSPPRPTSPTDSRDPTLQRQSEERRHSRLDSVKKALKTRKSSLYMPLSVAYPSRPAKVAPGARASSRSAPATPCGALVPNLLTFTQRVSASRHSSRSSRFDEESDPLLLDVEQSRTEHKF